MITDLLQVTDKPKWVYEIQSMYTWPQGDVELSNLVIIGRFHRLL
jgi:hypothetical protein